MEKDIKCELCGCVIGKEVSGKEKYYDRSGSFFTAIPFSVKMHTTTNSAKIATKIHKTSTE